MPTTELTEENFNQTIEDNDIVLVDFWAEWCGPCRMFGPIFERASEQHDDVVFGKVDTEDQGKLAGQFGIRSIPTLMAFREQELVFSQAGALPESALDELIRQVKDLDMDEVRQKIADHESQHTA